LSPASVWLNRVNLFQFYKRLIHLGQKETVNENFLEVKVIVRGEFKLCKEALKFMRGIRYFISAGKSRGIGYIKLNEKESMYAEVKGSGKIPKFDVLSNCLSYFLFNNN